MESSPLNIYGKTLLNITDKILVIEKPAGEVNKTSSPQPLPVNDGKTQDQGIIEMKT